MKKKKEIRNRWKKLKTAIKMVDFNPAILIITLSMNA